MLPSAKEFVKKKRMLGFQEFAEYFFKLKFGIIELAILKEDFHDTYKEKALKMPELGTINAIIQGQGNREFREFEQKVKIEMEKLSLTDKIEYLKTQLNEVQSIKEGEITKRKKKSVHYQLNHTIMDFDDAFEEPWYFFKSQKEHLEKILKKREYDLMVETTPIFKRVIPSFSDFEFQDWCLKVIKEEPDYKLPYYITIRTGLSKYAESRRKSEPTRNYYDVTRLCYYDHDLQMTIGPTNCFDDFINWLDNQVNLYSQEKPQIQKDMFFGNYKDMKFTEPILKMANDESINELDVAMNPNSTCKEFIETGVLCDNCKTNLVASKIPRLQFAQRKKWVDYQTDLRNDKFLFLDELQGMLRDNQKYFNDSDYSLVSNFETHIDAKRHELKASSATESVTKFQFPISTLQTLIEKANSSGLPKMKWAGADTELLELIAALYESGKIKNEKGDVVLKDIVEAFEKLFSFELKNFHNKISQMKTRKKATTPFLNSLAQSFDTYIQKNNEN